MILKRLFVPSNCLQGNEFSLHLLWPRDKVVNVCITIPKLFEVLRINNGEDPKLNENKLIVTQFEENGFLGVILKTPQLPEHSKDEEIIFEINDSNGNKQIEKRLVHLFRPSVEIVSHPKQIKVIKDKNQDIFYVEDKINFTNDGEGIAILGFNVLDDSQLKIIKPKGAAEFEKNFWTVLSEEIKEVNKIYPEHSSLLDEFMMIGTSPHDFSEKKIETVKEIFNELENVLLYDSTFAEKFINSVIVAYMKNIHMITEIESFITYLKSIESDKIIIDDPIRVLKIGKELKKLKAEITVTDLGYNIYPTIPIELDFIAEGDCEIPIHKLITVVQNNKVVK